MNILENIVGKFLGFDKTSYFLVLEKYVNKYIITSSKMEDIRVLKIMKGD